MYTFFFYIQEITLRKKHEQNRYHSQRYVNGTKCDLNGEGRKTEVRVSGWIILFFFYKTYLPQIFVPTFK